MPRKPSGGVDRQSINVRTRTDLKQALEKIAAQEGRSLAQEVERRLEQSLEEQSQKMGDPLPGIFNFELRPYLRSNHAVAQFLEILADEFMHITRTARARGRDEVEVRTALCAAVDLTKHYLLWRGEDNPPPLEGPRPAPGARTFDLPPAALGRKIAEERIAWVGDFFEEGVYIDTMEGRITDAYSGSGRETLFGPTPEEVEERKERERKAGRAALEQGDMNWDAPEKLRDYKTTVDAEPEFQMAGDAVEGEMPPAQSLKDLTSR
ncbi:hypothetical protein [Methylobacterium oryzisoli]|uniref:hypothetical protein n=1 Tax=Methylobacterium oryzisoli TaxID=3385502 RepID=UPI003891C93C